MLQRQWPAQDAGDCQRQGHGHSCWCCSQLLAAPIPRQSSPGRCNQYPRGCTLGSAPEGEQQAMSSDSEEPPSESCSSLVSLLSRYGTRAPCTGGRARGGGGDVRGDGWAQHTASRTQQAAAASAPAAPGRCSTPVPAAVPEPALCLSRCTCLSPVCQRGDDLAQHEQRTVDVGGLPQRLPHRLAVPQALRARQVHKRHLKHRQGTQPQPGPCPTGRGRKLCWAQQVRPGHGMSPRTSPARPRTLP